MSWLSLGSIVIFLGCSVEDSTETHAVCQAASKRCKTLQLNCPEGLEHITLDCGCGCLPSSVVAATGTGKINNGAQVQPAKEGPSVAQVTGDVEAVLPPSDRVFSVDLDGDGIDELIAAQGAKVWLYRLERQALVDLVIPSKGVLQTVTMGLWNGKRSVFLAFGRGRGVMDAPVEVFVGSPDCSAWTSILKVASTRSDISGLSYLGAAYGEHAGLLVSFYTSKYLVQTVRVTDAGSEVIHGSQRMAGHVTLWQTPSEGPMLKVVGRIYGDGKGEPGDLSLYQTARTTRRLVIQGGVRAVRVAQTRAGQTARLYVSDGWSAAYAKEAKAQLKEVRYDNGGYIVSQIGQSPEEYTFFELWARDLNGDGVDEIVARGNRYLTQFTRTSEGWRKKRLTGFGAVLNVALLKRDAEALGRWVIAIPDAKSTMLVTKASQEVTL